MSSALNVLSTADTTAGAGAYNRRITIQHLVTTGESDGMGGFLNVWQNVFSTWAHIEPYMRASSGGSSEPFRAGQLYPTRYVLVLIRYRPTLNIDASMQVKYGVQTYNIRQVNVPAEARTTCILLCEELQAQGSLH